MPKEFDVPKYLYKYRHCDTFTESIFTDHAFWLSSPVDFNDPFDCRFHLSVAGNHNYRFILSLARLMAKEMRPYWSAERINKHAKDVIYPGIIKHKAYYESYANQMMLQSIDRVMGVVSLSALNDDPTMWGHYANCHKGICLRFDTLQDSIFYDGAVQVIYTDYLTNLEFYDIARDLEINEMSTEWLFKKSKHWSYEKEWRICFRNGNRQKHVFNPRSLDGVILGCMISNEDEDKVRQWVSNYPNKIELFRAVKSTNKYALEIIKDKDYVEPIKPSDLPDLPLAFVVRSSQDIANDIPYCPTKPS